MNPYFSLSDKIYDLTQKYPELINLLAANGFENLRNDMMRKTVGRTISVEAALKSRHFDLASFEQIMVDAIEQKSPDPITLSGQMQKETFKGGLRLSGILPCPIRIQILEKLDLWLDSQPDKISYELQAASMGLGWLREKIEKSQNASDLSDLYLSAGFNLFFEKSVMGPYLEAGVFADIVSEKRFNTCFDNENIKLKDPRGQYAMIGMVPAIFMVNTELLGDRRFPKSWADLLEPEFENTIAMPVRDLDLFNTVLMGIYQKYGTDGIVRLGKGMLTSMHPAQMVKAGGKKQQTEGPVVTVMPYFFSCMAKENGPLRLTWPKDGAILSPIFLLAKKEAKERLKPLVDFLFSKEMGNVLGNGKFPSTHPEVDNGLTPEQSFLWPGWDFIYSHDIGTLLTEIEGIFLQAAGGGA